MVRFDQLADFYFEVRAPSTAGVYDMRFQLLGEVWFGPMTPNVKINVTA